MKRNTIMKRKARMTRSQKMLTFLLFSENVGDVLALSMVQRVRRMFSTEADCLNRVQTGSGQWDDCCSKMVRNLNEDRVASSLVDVNLAALQAMKESTFYKSNLAATSNLLLCFKQKPSGGCEPHFAAFQE